MSKTKVLLALCCCLAVFACTKTEVGVASRYVKSVSVSAEEGATISVSQAESGELAGSGLFIPPGALVEDTVITVEVGAANQVEDPSLPAGPVAVWGPAGTRFQVAAEMILPFGLPEGTSADDLYVDVLEDDGTRLFVEHAQLVVDSETGTVRFPVSGFTGYQPGIRGCTSANHPCPAYAVCQQGHCVGNACGNSTCAVGALCCNQSCVVPANGSTTCPAPSCSAANPCPVGQSCNAGTGKCETSCGRSYPNVACPTGQACFNGTCQASAGSGCHVDTDCPYYQTCSNGACQPTNTACGNGAACTSGQTCLNGACKVLCGANYPNAVCPSGQSCQNGVCQPQSGSCTGVSCPTDRLCVQGVCEQRCGANYPNVVCPQGTQCNYYYCAPAPADAGTPADGGTPQCGNGFNNCPTGYGCSNGSCVYSGGSCATYQGCPNGQTCVGGATCHLQCGPNAPGVSCPNGQTCINYVCQ